MNNTFSLPFFKITFFLSLFLAVSLSPMEIAPIPSLANLDQDLIKTIVSHIPANKKDVQYRLACKNLAQAYSMPSKLYALYGEKKYITPECAFLDCIKRNDLEAIEWFVKHLPDKHFIFLSNCYEQKYISLSPRQVASANNDITTEDKEKTMALLANVECYERYNVNHNLCLAACVGDIDSFEKELNTNNECNITNPNCPCAKCVDMGGCYVGCQHHTEHRESIPLVIWAATRNCDIDFLQNLQKYPEYKEYMEKNSDKFLRFAFVGFSFESVGGHDHLKNVPVSDAHLKRIKKLIDSRCFGLNKRNHDCQFSWNQHAVAYLDNIKDINPAFKEMHAYALKEALTIIDEQQKISALKISLLTGLLAGAIYYRFFRSDK
jgi:hypothetical protein